MTLDFAAISRELKRVYGITAEDAGFGPEDVIAAEGETVEQWVEWYGNKYGLMPIADIPYYTPPIARRDRQSQSGGSR